MNSIEIDGVMYLLAAVSGSHLAPEAQPGEPAQPAVQEWRVEMEEDWQSSYDMAALTAPRWRPTTLCGREWLEMESGDGPPLMPGTHPVYAPDCRTCLRIAGRRLTSTTSDDRIPLVVSLVADQIKERRSATITEVPGDQMEHLRNAIRTGLRKKKLRASTYPIDTTLFVADNTPMTEEEKAASMERIASALDWLDTDSPSPDTTTINWNTWGV